MEGIYLQKIEYRLHKFIDLNNLSKKQFDHFPRLSQNIRAYDFLIKNPNLINWNCLSGNKDIKAFQLLKSKYIFDDKIIIMLTKPDEYVAFEIESASAAAFLKIVFEMAWEVAG